MSGSVQPVEIILQPSEVPTVLAALRFWQAVRFGSITAFGRLVQLEEKATEDLNEGQIDVLCTMIERSAKR